MLFKTFINTDLSLSVMKTIIIKLGGSLVVPNEIDVSLLKEFRRIIEDYTKKGFRFGIVVGGGKTCRKYQKVA